MICRETTKPAAYDSFSARVRHRADRLFIERSAQHHYGEHDDHAVDNSRNNHASSNDDCSTSNGRNNHTHADDNCIACNNHNDYAAADNDGFIRP